MILMRVTLVAMMVTISLASKIFLFGSVLVYDGNPVYQVIIDSVGKRQYNDSCDTLDWASTTCGKVAVITSAAFDTQAGNDEYEIGDGEDEAPTKQFFLRLGMSPQHVRVHIDNYKETTDITSPYGQQLQELLSQADVVYFNGGDQSRHARCWLNDDGSPRAIFKIIRERVLAGKLVYIGVSAGTAITTKTTFGQGSSFGILYFANSVGLAQKNVSDGDIGGSGLCDTRNGSSGLQYDYNGGKMPGFDLLDGLIVDTHFDKRGRLGRLIPAMIDLKVKVAFGIDEFTTLYYQNGLGTVYGSNGVFVVDLSKASKFLSQYLTVKNANIHYLTAGDRYNFRTETLHSEKPLISQPQYPGYKDSDDILQAYQCSSLITRLIDQTGSYNLGRTIAPEQFPSNTPRLSLQFYRNSNSHGRLGENKYCAQNISLDISPW